VLTELFYIKSNRQGWTNCWHTL